MTPESNADVDQTQKAIADVRAGHFESFAPQILEMLARVRQAAGQHDEALAVVQAAFETSRRTGMAYWDAELHRLQASLLMQAPQPGLDAAEECFQRAIETARGQGARMLELRAAVGLARLLQQQGRSREARDLVEPILGGFREGLETKDLQDAARVLAASWGGSGRRRIGEPDDFVMIGHTALRAASGA